MTTNPLHRLLTLSLLLCACTTTPASKPIGAVDSLIGTWRVTQFIRHSRADTTSIYPFGQTPQGYLVYDQTGHVFFQVVRRAAMDSLQLGLQHGAPATQLLQLTNGFAGVLRHIRDRCNPANRDASLRSRIADAPR